MFAVAGGKVGVRIGGSKRVEYSDDTACETIGARPIGVNLKVIRGDFIKVYSNCNDDIACAEFVRDISNMFGLTRNLISRTQTLIDRLVHETTKNYQLCATWILIFVPVKCPKY